MNSLKILHLLVYIMPGSIVTLSYFVTLRGNSTPVSELYSIIITDIVIVCIHPLLVHAITGFIIHFYCLSVF